MSKIATASKENVRTSVKDAVVIFKAIKNKQLEKTKKFLNDLVSGKKSIKGKFYKTACREILELLKNAEANAEAKGLDVEKLFVKEALANKTFTFMLPKSRWSHRGKKAKLSKLKVKLEER